MIFPEPKNVCQTVPGLMDYEVALYIILSVLFYILYRCSECSCSGRAFSNFNYFIIFLIKFGIVVKFKNDFAGKIEFM